MSRYWESGCLRIELQDAEEPERDPLEDPQAKLYIQVCAQDGEPQNVLAEGQIGMQLAHLLHACMVLSGGEDEEWFVPNVSHPLHLRRQGRSIEIARYPAYVSHTSAWLSEDGFFLVDFGVLLESLSAAVEWILSEITEERAEDDMVMVLISQWEHAWQRFSRLATFRRVSLQPAL